MTAAIVLGCLAALLIIVLCVPLNIALNTDIYGKPRLRMQISWFFGLVKKEMTTDREEPVEKKETTPKKKEVVPQKRRAGWRKASTLFKIIRIKGLLKNTKDLIWDVLSSFGARNLVVDLDIGLGDPADTGLVFAFIGPVIPFLRFPFPHKINLRPSFRDELVLEGTARGKVRLLPVQLIPPLLKFGFSLPAAKAAKILVSGRLRRKR